MGDNTGFCNVNIYTEYFFCDYLQADPRQGVFIQYVVSIIFKLGAADTESIGKLLRSREEQEEIELSKNLDASNVESPAAKRKATEDSEPEAKPQNVSVYAE